jgi:hypothetical protein
MLHANELNREQGFSGSKITCIEPYPREEFLALKKVNHIQQTCQAVHEDVFAQLRDGDLLFIDSSHVVKLGSDVIRIYIDIIPKLAPGVFVHIHDVYFPYLYSPASLFEYFDWQESAFLLALLINNTQQKVCASLAALHHDCTKELQSLVADYRPRQTKDGLQGRRQVDGHLPSSIWLRTC